MEDGMRSRGIGWILGGERFRRLIPIAVTAAGLATGFGCATGRVANIDAYDEIAMNKVVPYPSTEELKKRSFDLVIVDREAVSIDASLLERPNAQVRRALEGLVAEAGATVIDRSLGQLGELTAEAVLGEAEGHESEDVTGADYALATRFSNYRYTAVWNEPFKLLWLSEEDIANKPGTCVHTAEIEVDVQLIEVGSNDKVTRTYTLEHSAVQKNKDLDPGCTIAPVTLGVLFEKALDEALICLNLPLGTRLAPRGHLTAHRKAQSADRHIYQVSLGSAQGIQRGDRVEIRREQRSTSPAGEETRTERIIATGEVTDQVRAQMSWIAADPANSADVLLDGDVVRPVKSEGLLSRLSGPNCDSILTER